MSRFDRLYAEAETGTVCSIEKRADNQKGNVLIKRGVPLYFFIASVVKEEMSLFPKKLPRVLIHSAILSFMPGPPKIPGRNVKIIAYTRLNDNEIPCAYGLSVPYAYGLSISCPYAYQFLMPMNC